MPESLTPATSLDLIFFALGDATRRDIISRLVEADMGIGELAEKYEMSFPAVTKHIGILEKSGLVVISKAGRNKNVSLQFDAIELSQIWLATLNDEASIWESLEEDIDSP